MVRTASFAAAVAALAGYVSGAIAGPDAVIAERATLTVTVNANQQHQTVHGFGFSEAFGFVDALYNLPAAEQTQALDLLFDTNTGAGLNIVRNRIGSTTYDSIEPNSPGLPSLPPQYVPPPNNDSNQLRFAKQAQAYGVNTFIADAWSAPAYMKTNNDESNGGYLCGVTGETCATGDWRQAFANYIVKYLQDYIAAGVPYTYVGFLNEPEFTGNYSSMQSKGTQAASFLQVLYPTLRAANLTTGISCCDSIGWEEGRELTAQIQAAGALNQVSLITAHSYTNRPNGPINTTLPVWMTEYADLRGSNVTQWYVNGGQGEGLTWANYIYQAVVLSNVSAYLHWLGIESGLGDSALIYIGSNNQLIPTARLWAFGQWSRYVRPGAVRLSTTGGTANMLASAFRGPRGFISVQLINNANAAQGVNVAPTGFTVRSASAVVSSNANSGISPLSVQVTNGQAVANIPARSMVTIVIPP